MSAYIVKYLRFYVNILTWKWTNFCDRNYVFQQYWTLQNGVVVVGKNHRRKCYGQKPLHLSLDLLSWLAFNILKILFILSTIGESHCAMKRLCMITFSGTEFFNDQIILLCFSTEVIKSCLCFGKHVFVGYFHLYYECFL